MSNRLTCIKPGCNKVYTSTEEEAYYCPDCLNEKNRIANEVDKKMAGRVTIQPKTELQIYEEMLQNNPISKGGVRVVNAKDLGLL